MNEMWNELDLKKPPLIVKSVKNARFAQKVLFSINNYLNRSKKTRSEFNEAFELLTRLYARRSNSFRHLIGFRAVSKLNVALKRVRIIDLERELESFRSTLPDISLADHPQGELPTRQNLEFILVRCITMHYIYKRIEECCLGVADFCVNNIHLNRFLDYSTLLLANVAKIKTLNATLGNKSKEMYSELLEQRFKFPNGKHEFVKADTELPQPAELEQFEETNQAEDKAEQQQQQQQQQITINPNSVNVPKILKVDMGKAVQRQDATSSKKSNKFDIKKLDSVEKVRKFIESETKSRKKCSNDCVTHKLQNHEWMAAKKLFERKILANDMKKALNTFCKFISSKI